MVDSAQGGPLVQSRTLSRYSAVDAWCRGTPRSHRHTLPVASPKYQGRPRFSRGFLGSGYWTGRLGKTSPINSFELGDEVSLSLIHTTHTLCQLIPGFAHTVRGRTAECVIRVVEMTNLGLWLDEGEDWGWTQWSLIQHPEVARRGSSEWQRTVIRMFLNAISLRM